MHYGENRIYKKIEVIGVSGQGIEEAVQTALSKARESLDELSWFEVKEIRGHIDKEGKVDEYQVGLLVSFLVK